MQYRLRGIGWSTRVTVELLIWNTIGTGPEAIPYDGYSTADKINKEMSLF
jgi:hypothetical protein